MLGPVIRAVVGDTIEVVFKNNASARTASTPHGVFYDKGSEGAPYNDGTAGGDKDDDAVAPGGTYTYSWPGAGAGRARAGGRHSVLWMYHSHT